MKIQSTVTFFGILVFLQISLPATHLEPERYDPREYFNRGSNIYEMMDKAKELTGLLEARMEHLLKLKLEDAKRSNKGCMGNASKGNSTSFWG